MEIEIIEILDDETFYRKQHLAKQLFISQSVRQSSSFSSACPSGCIIFSHWSEITEMGKAVRGSMCHRMLSPATEIFNCRRRVPTTFEFYFVDFPRVYSLLISLKNSSVRFTVIVSKLRVAPSFRS